MPRSTVELASEYVPLVEPGLSGEEGWLVGLDIPFDDPLVAAVAVRVGYDGMPHFPTQRLDAAAPHLTWEPRLILRRSILAELPLARSGRPRIQARRIAGALIRRGYRIAAEPWRIVSPGPAHLEAGLCPDAVVAWLLAIRHVDLEGVAFHGRRLSPRVRGRRAADWTHHRCFSKAPDPAPTSGRLQVVEAPPGVTVAIASRNRRDHLLTALTAFAEQQADWARFEVVVVLDGSTDGSKAALDHLAVPYDMRTLQQPHRGLAAARNHGARAGRFPLVLFFDDDLVPRPTLIDAHLGLHRSNGSRTVAIGPCEPVIEEGDIWSAIVRGWWSDYYFRSKHQVDHRWDFDDMNDGNASMTVSLLEEAGWFDEDFAGRKQDWELGIRLLAAGARGAFSPAAAADHHVDLSLSVALKHRRQEALDDYLLALKHPQVIGQLLLRRAHDDLSSRGGATRLRAAEHALLANAVRAAAPALDRFGLRRLWLRLFGRAMWSAYKLGLLEAAPDPAERAAVLRADPAPRSLDVDLRARGPVQVPRGRVDLRLTNGAGRAAVVSAPDAGEPWNWDTVVDACATEIRSSWRPGQGSDDAAYEVLGALSELSTSGSLQHPEAPDQL